MIMIILIALYEYRTRPAIFREECELRVFQNRVLRGSGHLVTGEVTGRCGTFTNTLEPEVEMGRICSMHGNDKCIQNCGRKIPTVQACWEEVRADGRILTWEQMKYGVDWIHLAQHRTHEAGAPEEHIPGPNDSRFAHEERGPYTRHR
jgi:hypothetical protein